jgi:hypothetical protein
VKVPCFQLQERDKQLVEWVWRLRFATTQQLSLLVGIDNPIVTRRRLRHLVQHSYLVIPRDAQVLRFRGDERCHIFGLGDRAYLILTELGHAVPKSRWTDKNRARRFSTLLHDIALSRFHTSLELACQRLPGVRLEAWFNESHSLAVTLWIDEYNRLSFRARRDRGWTKYHVQPDALFVLNVQGLRRAFALEIDNNTEDHGRLAHKLQGYSILHKHRLHRQLWGLGADFRVLVVFKTRRRLAAARTRLLAPDNRHRLRERLDMYWLLTQEDYRYEEPEELLASRWQTLGGRRDQSILV